MNKDTNKDLWTHALSRFQHLDWEEPIKESQENELYSKLPKQNENETVQDWLNRVLISSKKSDNESISAWVQRIQGLKRKEQDIELSTQKIATYINMGIQSFLEAASVNFTPFTEIIRKTASSADSDDFPLPEIHSLTTEDECFKFKIEKQEDSILIKVEAIEKFANTAIALSDTQDPDKVSVAIGLNYLAEGEIKVVDTLAMRKMLWNPIIGSISD